MIDKKYKAFIDESGSVDLATEKPGASNLYICVAVLVKSEQVDAATYAMHQVSKNYFSGGTIKSSSIGKNAKRRLQVLGEVEKIEYSYYAIIVDKTKLSRDSGGLKYKQVYYKYINKMLYRWIRNRGYYVEIIADKFGTSEFTDSFANYLNKQGLLPFTHELSFCNSKDEPLIQLADLVAGTLLHIYDPEKKCENSFELRNILKNKEIGNDCWPIDMIAPYKFEPPNTIVYDETDKAIKDYNIMSAMKFEEMYQESTEADREMQIAALKYLLFNNTMSEDTGSIPVYSQAIVEHLDQLGFERLSLKKLLSNVIGPLRDEGLLIAGNHEGYRLVACVEDIKMYQAHVKSIIEPMLKRLKKARESVKIATANQVDIMAYKEFCALGSILEAFDEHRLSKMGSCEK